MTKLTNDLIFPISELLNPDYIGSVQRLHYTKDNSDLMICETTSGGSVFDVGTIFSIKNNDKCRTAIRHKIFMMLKSPEAWRGIRGQLEQYRKSDSQFVESLDSGLVESFKSNGATTHHIGMIDEKTGNVIKNSFPSSPSNFVVVKKYKILKPSRTEIASNKLWDYSLFYKEDKYVIPLENIVRFGLTSGSSIYKRYLDLDQKGRESYIKELGLVGEMKPWTVFNRPIVDFTTKFEPDDRNLSLQEAFYISGQSHNKFNELISMSVYGSILVSDFFGKIGLYLWDIKWEIAKDSDKLVFVDTIDTDSVRVTARIDYDNKLYHVHYNKQAMRDYYKIMFPDWYAAIIETKKLAQKSGNSFLELLSDGQARGEYPPTPEVDSEFIKIQEQKFDTILAYLFGSLSPDNAVKALSSIGTNEIKYYKRSPRFDSFCELNRI